MRIRSLYMVIGITICSTVGKGQARIDKSGELWAVWEEAGRKLEAGQFDEAAILYRAYEPNFSSRLRQTEQLKKLYMDGLKLQRAGRYAEAVETYRRHRNYEGVGSLTAFDKKIDECMKKLAGAKSTRYRDPDRRIIASELAYKGLKKLRDLDTLGALRDYRQAREFGGDYSSTLREQYEEGLKITAELREWGQRYKKQKNVRRTPAQEKEMLESYRRIKGVPVINTVESRIMELTAEIEGRNSLASFAQNCESDLLISYVRGNKSKFAFSDSLIGTLNQYKSMQGKINLLKSNVENSKTVGSAYFSLDSMVNSIKGLPADIKNSLSACIKSDRVNTFEGYANLARLAGNASEARKFEDIAQGRQSTVNQLAEPCEGLEKFNNGILAIQKELAECDVSEARKIWKEIGQYIANCENRNDILNSHQELVKTLTKMEVNQKAFDDLKKAAAELVQERRFKSATEKYDQMSKMQVCNVRERDREVNNGRFEIKSRLIKPMFRFGITAGLGTNKPTYRIATQEQRMSYGLVSHAGMEFSYIDHRNPIDLVAALEYLDTRYYQLSAEGSATHSYKIKGAALSVAIKLHPSNTNPNNLRPYLKIGREALIPLAYSYENYFTRVIIKDRSQLRNVVSSIQGGLGLEMQRKDYGFFIEGNLNYGVGEMYSNRSTDPAVPVGPKIDARMRRAGIRLGFRF